VVDCPSDTKYKQSLRQQKDPKLPNSPKQSYQATNHEAKESLSQSLDAVGQSEDVIVERRR
jgi:hypothetical protein